MKLNLIRRRTVWWPTWQGALLLFVVVVAPVLAWGWWGERYLSLNDRIPAETLVVESWIQPDALHAAAAEYRAGGYRHLVVTGGLTGSRGAQRRRSYAAIAERELVRAGIPRERILAAPIPDVESQRTHAMAVGVREALAAAGIEAASVNVFSDGAHARRSRLVYAKVFGPQVKVGVIAWTPWPFAEGSRAWWTSSERTLDLFKETLAYPYELLLNSGRTS